MPFTVRNGKVDDVMANNNNDIWKDGLWLAHRYDASADAFHLRPVSRAAHNAATFLTDEYLGVEPSPLVLSRHEAKTRNGQNASLHFILHSAFCASTMFANGFDLPGQSMGLKEPVLLNDIVGFRRRGAPPIAVGERLRDALDMLARPFGDDLAVVVKPSNIFNALASASLAMRPTSKAILLHAPLSVFLLSVARKGLWCRLWCRELLEGQIADGIVDLGFEPGDFFRQTDLQIAAVGWLAQQKLFHDMARKYGPERIATLDSERLTANPGKALLAAAAHFGLGDHAAANDTHPAFGTHSKFGGSFRTEDRRAEYALAQTAHGDEIEKILIWAEAVAQSADIPLTLEHALRF
ncbi:hypothetical protein [Sphingorhabdus sp.]|uniref:hypothetical protein n=1 Tax=Sphingorhabdus sp. TaxID=1902408 RepID=UPI00378529CD